MLRRPNGRGAGLQSRVESCDRGVRRWGRWTGVGLDVASHGRPPLANGCYGWALGWGRFGGDSGRLLMQRRNRWWVAGVSGLCLASCVLPEFEGGRGERGLESG